MDLIVITPEELIDDEIELANTLLEGGLTRLHIRKPLFSEQQYCNYINAIDEKYHSRIVTHNFFHLFHDLKLGGIHLNSASRNDRFVWEQVQDISPAYISASFHSWKEVEDGDFQYSYVFISPVFDSISKIDYMAAIDLDGAAEVKQSLRQQRKYCPRIIGLGGVGPQQLNTLRQKGFDGAAMLGSIWLSEYPLIIFQESMAQLKSI